MGTKGRQGTSKGFVSLADVARLAGTSHSAASRAINGRVGVRADIREAVLAAAKELGYTPNTAARNLVMQRTGLVALVFCDPDQLVGTTFFSDLLASVVTRLDDADYRTALILPRERRRGQLGDLIGPENYDGALVIGHRAQDPMLNSFLKRKLPTVVLGRPLAGPDVSFVDVDNVAAARTATRHLIDVGRRRLLHLAGPEDTSWGVDRVTGFRSEVDAAAHDGVTGRVQQCAFSAEGGYAATRAALQEWPDPDGVLVSSEALLPGATAALAEAGRTIPDDLALVAFDDGPRLAFANPPITAVRQPLVDMGHALARSLLDAMANSSIRQQIYLPASLEIRASSRLPS